ncbi:MAG TPA: dethiobiotin synthase [Polyangiaceae bacterium]|jgi:dethiobiotin synthetase|nr:dethiobiotin synthase [Polyangiaceae bacterium]
MPRLIVLGCGTGVGKTRVGVALLHALRAAGERCEGLKPIESGIELISGAPPPGSDAHVLGTPSNLHNSACVAPLYALPAAVSPHLAARRAQIEIRLDSIAGWVGAREQELTTRTGSHRAGWLLIETAGGVFSPLSERATNFDLARALDPAIWVLVASDSLGVLHEVTATLTAMRARGRSADHLVLCAARTPDLSTGTNAGELELLGIGQTSAVLARDDDSGISLLLTRLLNAS